MLPFLLVLYVTAFIDRVNVGFAGLDMTRELHFSNEVFGFGAGIFFFGYCLLEIPGAVLAARWSARKWIAIVMVTWGVLAACTGFVNSGMQFHVIRFLVGFAEGGFFPAVVVYLTFWFRQQDRAKAVATFMAAIPVAQAVGAPIAGYLLRLDWLGVSAWRWLLFLEGIPAFLLGIVTLFYLPDRPADVRWLSSAEKDWITAELASELRGKLSSQGHFTILRAFTRPVVLALAVSYFFVNTAGYAISIWLPKIIQDFRGFSTLEISLVAAIPPALAIPTMLIVGWHSDRTGERRWHAAGAALAAAVGLAVSQIPGSHAVAMAGFTIAVMGVMSYYPPFWAMPTRLLEPGTAAASVGFINLIANFGGFAGPYALGFLTDRTGTYLAGVLFLVSSAVLAAVILAFLPGRASKSGLSEPVRYSSAKAT